MKKLISIDQLATGMFLEADVVKESGGGGEQRFLEARNAVSTGIKGKRAGGPPQKDIIKNFVTDIPPSG